MDRCPASGPTSIVVNSHVDVSTGNVQYGGGVSNHKAAPVSNVSFHHLAYNLLTLFSDSGIVPWEPISQDDHKVVQWLEGPHSLNMWTQHQYCGSLGNL